MSIVLENLTRRYGPARAVDDLSATIPTGCFFTVLGPSGCGKSTLLRMIAGLEPVFVKVVVTVARFQAACSAGPAMGPPPPA